MNNPTTSLNDGFGFCIEGVTPSQLADADFQHYARDQWMAHRGLLAVRGPELAELSPQGLTAWGQVFGRVDESDVAARANCIVPGSHIFRIGNVRDESGALKASLARVPALRSDADVRYDPDTRRPVWHTDSTFKQHPPIGSVFQCRIAPPEGGDTLFADTCAAFEHLAEADRQHLERFEAVCSLAHHDKKINSYSPDYPILTPEQRAANPPQRVPVVLHHPLTGKPALYGLNSSTCAVVEKGTPVSDADMDRYDLDGVEDPSVGVLRDLLPYITGPEFTVRWRWQPGDIVVWDNRSTMHAASGYDYERFDREMWRLTLL